MKWEETKVSDEYVVVTGGSAGIGRACVKRVLASGRKVINLDRKGAAPEDGETFIEVDMTDPTAVEAAFAQADQQGRLVGLVNNAGMSLAKSLMETEAEDFDLIVRLNLVAPAICAKLAAPRMEAAGWGRIVNISSRVVLGKELRTAYAGTKGGLAAMTRVWALELAAKGITVNTICPGPIATDLFNEVNPPGSPRTQKIIDSVPVRRVGTPDDIANAAAFFLQPESSFVTGQTLFVCGGLTVGLAGG